MDGEIDPAELAALLDEERGDNAEREGDADTEDDADDLRIVDIRDRRAFDRGHLPESECIPFPELTSRIAELEGATRIVTVCPHGKSSVQAARLVSSYEGVPEDARVESMAGGLSEWEYDFETEETDEVSEGPDSPF